MKNIKDVKASDIAVVAGEIIGVSVKPGCRCITIRDIDGTVMRVQIHSLIPSLPIRDILVAYGSVVKSQEGFMLMYADTFQIYKTGNDISDRDAEQWKSHKEYYA